MARIVLTDHPWPDLNIEHAILARAGHELVSCTGEAGTAEAIEDLVKKTDPAGIMTCWAPVSTPAVRAPSRLALIARIGVGIDNIAVDEATLRGAYVTNVPDYCTGEVSDHAIALMLAHYRGIVRFDRQAQDGLWRTQMSGLERISELTVAIVGLGRIGRETARKLAAFGCRVLALSSALQSEDESGIGYASLSQIQSEADVVILHVPLTDRTSKLIDRAFLQGCQKSPLLINVSRGGVVDNDALLWALNDGRLRGAALDVIDGEPAPPEILIRHPLAIVTPHIAFASAAAMRELRTRACEEVVRVLAGEPPHHPCNRPVAGTPLPGGVASDIRIIQAPAGPHVIKRSLAKLRVATDWFSDPARSSTEVAAIESIGPLIGEEHVPHVLWSDPEKNTFAMSLIGEPYKNWKTELMNGRVDPRTASSAGNLLGCLHSKAADQPALRARFENIQYFHELRVEPFFSRVAKAEPELGAHIERIAQEMLERRETLVHGDFSPKNILADGANIVLLDFEVTHWGDARFDAGFCAAHLLLKSARRGAPRSLILECLRRFLEEYQRVGPPVLDRHLVEITGCLLMARLSGASPIEYLTDIDQSHVRSVAMDMICRPEPGLDSYLIGTRGFA
jgi:phosphoglycerate dehydrogenase-like enzyme